MVVHGNEDVVISWRKIRGGMSMAQRLSAILGNPWRIWRKSTPLQLTFFFNAYFTRSICISGSQWVFGKLVAALNAPLVCQIQCMIMRECLGDFSVWGTPSPGDIHCLGQLIASYRTHYQSLVSILTNMFTFRCRVCNEKQAVERCCMLSTDSAWGAYLLTLHGFSGR